MGEIIARIARIARLPRTGTPRSATIAAVIPSERIQRRIDNLLDEAEAAISDDDRSLR